MSFATVKKKREASTFCVQTNRHFNPYSYRGVFIGFLDGQVNIIERSLKKVNLDSICSCFTVLNLNCAVYKHRFAHFAIKNGFSSILKGKTDAYEKTVIK